MILEEEYNVAVEQEVNAKEIINQYHKEQMEAFNLRMKVNPVFTDEELKYSAVARCHCGHGLAYPKGCSINYYWDCSAILKGIADDKVSHTDKLPFMFYSIKGENESYTTREIIVSKKE